MYFIGGAFSLFGAFMPPTSDAYRYRQTYLATSSFSLDFSHLYTTTDNKDFLYPLLSFIFNGTGATFELFKLAILTCCYSLYVWMFIDIVKHSPILQKRWDLQAIAIACTFFSIRLFTLVAGIRFGFASTIIIIGIYLISSQRYKAGVCIVILSMAMHFSMLLIIPFILVGYTLKKQPLNGKAILFVLLVLILFSNSAIGSILSVLFPSNDLVQGKTSAYIDGQWGTEAMANSMSLGGLIFTLVRIIPVIPLGIFAINTQATSFLRITGLLLVGLLCICFSSFTLLLRYSNVTIAILFIWLLTTATPTKRYKNRLRIALYSFLIMFGCYAYTQRHVFKTTSLQYVAIMCPSFLIIDNTYSDSWINQHIGWDGELKSIK